MTNGFNILSSQDAIAIIGIAGRFPGAQNVDKFWHNIRDGLESISCFTDEELVSNGIDSTVFNNPNYVKAGTVIEDIELFDAAFFGFTPREAEITDIQHRIFLESVWEALENAGYDSENYAGQIGLFAGGNISSYLFSNLYPNQDLLKSIDRLQISIGNDKDHLPTQISYKLNFKGPSINVQTSCSTSLVAIHLACQSLLNGESDIALAGGVSIQVPQKVGYQYQEGGINSPDGHCRSFDINAQGTVFGNGLGVVVLKRLEDAIADGDCIHALIKSSAINNDGSLKVGYTAPSVDGQREVILEALVLAGVEPETITYIEAHGTGTSLGDPIEIAALTQAFRASTNKKCFCAIGSVKTNIGHLNTAAGVSGLIKTVQALKHKQIPPSLHFQAPNPQIDFANSPFYVNTQLSEWKTNEIPRRAGVSSFGIGGTNAHVILEEAPVVEPSGTSRLYQLLLFSAKTSTALESITANVVAHLQQNPDITLADVAYTLQVGRRAFEHRRIVVCHDIDDALKVLTSQNPDRIFTNHHKPSHCPVVFMFSGQGTQYVNMARELYEEETTFREQVDICSEILKPHLGIDLRHVLYPSEDKIQKALQQLQQTAITQPALFVIEYALAKLWMSWGVHPEAMIGHSIGEYVAAAIAGVFSLEDALTIVATRGKLMQQLPTERMSGISPLPGGFDCAMVEPILKAFVQAVKTVKLNPPRIRFISNVTGNWITNEEATNPSYWGQHLWQSVMFSDGISQLLQQIKGIFLEVGPGGSLSTLTTQHLEFDTKQLVLTSLRHAEEEQSDISFLLQTLGQLWLAGVEIDWSGFYTHEQRHRLPLPTYPFERQKYWIEPQKQEIDRHPTPVLLGKKPDIADWFYIPFWKPSLPSKPLKPKELASQKSCVLVFIDECGLGTKLVKQLEQQKQDVITVKIGANFTKIDEYQYTLNPDRNHDYNTLIKELLIQEKLPTSIIHLWNVTPVIEKELEIEEVKKAQKTGFYSLLFLAQALGQQETSFAVKITVISNNLQPVIGSEILCPEKATLLGPIKVISQEYSNISCHSIDVILPSPGSRQEEKLVEKLLTELSTVNSEKVIAYRGMNRWVQSFEPVRFEQTQIGTPRLRQGGVYLITGGLGGIGLVMAEYLAQTVQAKLLLISRSTLPKRDDWEQWLATHNETDSISRKIIKVQELEQLGAEVLVVSADVSNTEQMQAAIAQAQLRFGQLNGVIHAAGILKDKSFAAIENITQRNCEDQFQPKVDGLLVLNKILQDKELDFCFLLSSLSSVLGGLGYVAYSAANIFMDAFVHQHNQKNLVSWISINWDSWQLEKENKQNTSVGTSLNEFGFSPKEGIQAFQRILNCNEFHHLVVSTGELQARIEQWINLESFQKQASGEPTNLLALHPRPDLQNPYIPLTNEIEQTIAKIWQENLGIKDIGLYDNFFELGGDSLLIIQVHRQLVKTLNKNLSIADLFKYSTISALTKYLSEKKVQTTKLQQVNERANKKEVAIQEKRQLMQQRRKADG
ncbi:MULTISPECIES: type I polyketide synthase [Nostoc]|uniref:SDR family NAD(P)-dependent oxidoreductase n=1 Tax=Nostoc punctiforme FACHB-252 TaxID=1357509 RepID=A0ABR8HIK7_NOSPU|nr:MULTISPECIES: type I polyketide synthase [Nostoc]MBC1236337.1 SDR family NAD(P)-dependent oxidoreductase [Nostoc sp. 2RC]MBD2615686.1 SDR family NAD(P)-dependent oxidoreductase [Nostoc punctiforme FACHB-252]